MNDENENETGVIMFTVKFPEGAAETLEARKEMTIGEFKQKLSNEKYPMESRMLILHHRGKKLDENKTFEDYNITSEDIIHVLVKLPGGCY